MRFKTMYVLLFCCAAIHIPAPAAHGIEQRNSVSYLRGPYNIEFYKRHEESYRNSAAIHFAHGKQHDILQLTPLHDSPHQDGKADAEFVDMIYHPPVNEPVMEYWAPYTARTIWKLYRAIDWTHMHHEQTYDILSDKSIAWSEKKAWTDRAVDYYLHRELEGIPRSPAPLDVTMRRAAVMMKPYFAYFRNKYPHSNNFFYAAHWWHPVIYEAQMLGGNGEKQDEMVDQTNQTFYREVLRDRPKRMLLSREAMPRYSRMSPESANIFDNLHMLHGIAYDLLAYEGWTVEEKRKEMYRVIKAMSYQPGDEQLARKFKVHPDIDPRVYSDWMKGAEGDMNRIMREMMEEMMPMMMPQGMSPDMREKVMAQFRMKLSPGMQEAEMEGSLHDALHKLMPGMKMMPESMKPGESSAKMVEVMLDGWRHKYGGMPDIEPISMERDPAEGGAQ